MKPAIDITLTSTTALACELKDAITYDIWFEPQAGEDNYQRLIDKTQHLMQMASSTLCEQALLLKQFFAFYNGIKDMVENERLSEVDIEDDFQWLATSLDQITESIESKKTFLNNHGDKLPYKSRYFVCSITEINGECEYTSTFLMEVKPGECPDTQMGEIFTNYRGEGSLEHDSFVWFPDGLAAKNPEYNEISESEFLILQQHLSVL